MFSAAPLLAEASDPAIQRAEWCLTRLEELTEIGMKLARDLVQDAPAGADTTGGANPKAASPPAKAPSRIEEFAKISRAVRLTITLVGRTDNSLRALRAGLPAEIEAQRTEAKARAERITAARHKERGDLVTKLVLEAAERDVDDNMVVCAMEDAIDQRLDMDEAYRFIADLPLRDVVENLCHDLKLEADWSLWVGDGWAQPGPFYRSRHSPFRRRSHECLDDNASEYDPQTDPDATPVVQPIRPGKPPDPPPG